MTHRFNDIVTYDGVLMIMLRIRLIIMNNVMPMLKMTFMTMRMMIVMMMMRIIIIIILLTMMVVICVMMKATMMILERLYDNSH